MNQLVPISSSAFPALVAAGERSGGRFLEFLAANLLNPHTRRVYARAADEFLAWCAAAGVPSKDSPLEESGFEPVVPLHGRRVRDHPCRLARIRIPA